MRFLQNVYKQLTNFGNSTLKFVRKVVEAVTSFRISNWLSFVAAVLGFVGTFVIVMDKFGPIHRKIDQLQKWENISVALQDMDTFDTENKSGKKIGMVEAGRQGFKELVDIILSNRPDLLGKDIVAIAKNQPMALGGVPFKIVHVAYANNPKADSLTTEYLFYEWVRDYREKYFLKTGLILIALGFLIGVCGHFKRKNKVNT
jgi:hypothetical protein